jgi:hypothetical protein
VHAPEQQSALLLQSSHSSRHPPAPAQRFTPSPVSTQSREQHSCSILQGSPTCLAHIRPSLELQPGSFLQRDVPLGSAPHMPEQQSSGFLQISPSARQPWRSAQRNPVSRSPSVHAPPQHSLDMVQLSPAGLHPPPAGAHFPAMQTSEQQSELAVHVSPIRAHQPLGAHDRSHFTEQHSPA